MSSPLTQSILRFLIAASIVSMASGIYYFVFRAIEIKSQILSGIFNVSVLVFLIISNIAYPFLLVLAFFIAGNPNLLLFIIVISGLMAFIHRKVGGASKNLFVAFWPMLMTSFFGLSVFGILIIFPVFSPTFPVTPPRNLIESYLSIQPLIPIVLFWIIKSYRLRPGIDKHFDE